MIRAKRGKMPPSRTNRQAITHSFRGLSVRPSPHRAEPASPASGDTPDAWLSPRAGDAHPRWMRCDREMASRGDQDRAPWPSGPRSGSRRGARYPARCTRPGDRPRTGPTLSTCWVSQAATRLPDWCPSATAACSCRRSRFYRGAPPSWRPTSPTRPRRPARSSSAGTPTCRTSGLASPERRLVFDLNDFDETLPGPFEWDVKRLAASFAVAGRDNGFAAKERRRRRDLRWSGLPHGHARVRRRCATSTSGTPTLDVDDCGRRCATS